MTTKSHRQHLTRIRIELQEERGSYCEYCQERYWTDLHHALIKRDKRFSIELDQKVNFMCVCHYCHLSGYVDPHEVKILFYWIQKFRGNDPQGWIDSLPLKVKPHFPASQINLELLAIEYTHPIRGLLMLENIFV